MREEDEFNEQSNERQTIIIERKSQSNGLGTTGFVFALIALFLGWIPVLGWVLWVLGFVFSLVGVFKTPKGLAIAGLVISLVDLILLLFVFALIMAAIGAFTKAAVSSSAFLPLAYRIIMS